MTTPAPSENPPPQLFVEVRGFLELVKTVDDQGNPTDQQPLLLKLINAPPPMTPAEAEEIRNSAQKAKEEKVEAEAAQKKAEEERNKALEDVKERLNAIEEDKKKMDEANAEQKKAHEEAMAKLEEEKKSTIKAQQEAAESIKKAEKNNEAIVDKLKHDLEKVKSHSSKELKAAVAKAKEELQLERTAAEELLKQAKDKASFLEEEVEKLKTQIASQAEARAPAEPASSSVVNLIEPLGTPPTSSVEGSAGNNEIDQLIAEHLNWKNELEDNSNPLNSVVASMPDGADRGAVVVEQVLALPGNEIFPPKSYFVHSAQDDALYKSAMRSRDTNFRDRVLRQLAEKRNRLAESARHSRELHRVREQRNHPPPPPSIVGVDPRYSGAFAPDPHYSQPAAAPPRPPQYETRAVTPQPNHRIRTIVPPRNGWLCCTSSHCCAEGSGCCADCDSPSHNYYRR